eukprot:TRINITY_DN5332_c0_g1_i1.p1 TRINITY_DN5332_c0_g1~~TRINITY_DN5332_c0_g1_i1.p1  ORF type:complete len:369 (+),score=66.17 TRINITY_DN5332_c0_g1_i1:46-1107(+)
MGAQDTDSTTAPPLPSASAPPQQQQPQHQPPLETAQFSQQHQHHQGGYQGGAPLPPPPASYYNQPYAGGPVVHPPGLAMPPQQPYPVNPPPVLATIENPYAAQQQQQQQQQHHHHHHHHHQIQQPQDEKKCNGGVMFEAVYNGITGSVLQVVGSYDKSAFKASTIYLHRVNDIFKGQKCGWNKDYDAAKTIFGRGITGMTARSAIHVEHKLLYGPVNSKVVTGAINTGADFLKLIDSGLLRGEMVFFTYVINEKGEMKFSHTGKNFLADKLSKHAMHSDASENVYFAGEFHVIYTDKGPLLIFDNNSGTYAPAKARLPLVKELFESNFPGLMIDVWDREDERLKYSISSCPTR